MSVTADALVRDSRVPRSDSLAAPAGAAAWLGTCLLVLAAPFEGLRPVVRLPGQALSSLETALLIVVLAWTGASLRSGVTPLWRTPLSAPWIVFGIAAGLAALVSTERVNGLHMTGRFGLAFVTYLVTVNGVTSLTRLRRTLAAAAVAGAVVSALVFLEYANVQPIVDWLNAFRVSVSHIGAQVRAGGPFQYPTIASMYQEITFALTLGLLLAVIDAGRFRLAAVLALVLAAIAQSITLTFTRAGLITMAATLGVVAILRFRERGADRGFRAVAALALVIGLQVVSSRSLESLRLRMTTEGSDAWYHATIEAPAQLSMPTGGSVIVPVKVTNTGFSSWDPNAANPIRFSYHWLLANADRVVSWEGARTEFPATVAAGDTVALPAKVIAPRQSGEYRLMWDIEQEDRLWFSTEPDADLFVTHATVTGAPAEPLDPSQMPGLPAKAIRPGRLALWRAAGLMSIDHPVLGVGPDNFRLQYGSYAGLSGADRRLHSNNMYLEVLTGTGLVGALAFLWMVSAAARVSIRFVERSAGSRSSPLAAGIVAAAVAIALHGFVDSFLSFTGIYTLMAITLGLVVAGEALHQVPDDGRHPALDESLGGSDAHRV